MKRVIICFLILMCLPVWAMADGTIDWTKPVVALTFDDGPGPYTEELLQLLEQNNCRATFFLLGTRLAEYPEVVEMLAQSDNEIGSHGWAHENADKVNDARIGRSIETSKQAIEEATGRIVRFYRPPYGSANSATYRHCEKRELYIIVWSLDSFDWDAKSADDVVHSILTRVKSGDIVLCHDIHSNTVEAMKKILPELTAQGYQMVTVGEMLSHYELAYRAKYSKLDWNKVNVQN